MTPRVKFVAFSCITGRENNLYLNQALSLDALIDQGGLSRKLLCVLKPELVVGQILAKSPLQGHPEVVQRLPNVDLYS